MDKSFPTCEIDAKSEWIYEYSLSNAVTGFGNNFSKHFNKMGQFQDTWYPLTQENKTPSYQIKFKWLGSNNICLHPW